MAQIVSSSAKPDRVNIQDLDLVGVPDFDKYILVSSDNSMSSDGKANFDYYIVGDGETPAPELELKPIVKTAFNVEQWSNEPVASGELFNQLYGKKIEFISTTSVNELAVGSSKITSNSVASVAYFFAHKGKNYNIVVSATNSIRFGFTKVVPELGVSVLDYEVLTRQVDKAYTPPSDGYICISYATSELNSIDVQLISDSYGIGVELDNLKDSIYTKTKKSIKTGIYTTNSPGLYYQSTSGNCCVFNVTEGQRIIIYGKGDADNAKRLWALYNANDRRIHRFASSGNFRTNPEIVVVPNGVEKMVVNLYEYDSATDGVYIVGNESETEKLSNDISELQNIVGSPTDEVFVEVGGIIFSSGNTFGLNTTNNARARTNQFLTAPFKVTTGDGFIIQNVFKYPLNSEYNITNAASYIGINASEYETADENYLYRIAFKKTDDSQIYESELDGLAEKIGGISFYMEYLKELMEEPSASSSTLYVCDEPTDFITAYDELIQKYDAIANDFPTFVTKNTLGQNSLGTNIYEYVISGGSYNGKQGVWGTVDESIPKPIFGIWAGIHGYERSAPNSLYLIFKDIMKGNGVISSLLEKVELHIIPCLNPWGFDNDNRLNPNSVDLNRNFDAGWVSGGNNGSSAASELETQIAQTWITNMAQLGVKFIIDWHNSLHVQEINCISTPNNSINGTIDFKHAFLRGTSDVASILINKFNVPEDSTFTYTSVDNTGGKSGRYMTANSVVGGYAETTWNPDGKGINTTSAAAIGATSMGNALIALSDFYGL